MTIAIGCRCGRSLQETTDEPLYNICEDVMEPCDCDVDNGRPLWFNCPDCKISYDWYACRF